MRAGLGMWWVLIGGCGGSGGAGEDSTPDSVSDSWHLDDTASDPTEDRSASLAGTVMDGEGTPVVAAELRLCRGPACRNSETNSEGAYAFADVHVDWHAFEIRPPAGAEGLATAFVPLQFDPQEARDVPVVLPSLDPSIPLPSEPTELEVGSGLLITLDNASLEPPLFEDSATDVAGVLLQPAEQMPVDLPGTVVAMWYLEPFNHEAPAGTPIRVTNRWERPDGSEYQLLVGSYGTSEWLDAGTLQVDGDRLQGTAALPLFSTVVLLAP